jgi:integrase/recombinase XerD
MRDPLRVRVSGPLGPFVSGFVDELGGQGYARLSVVAQVQLVAHLSRWMAAERVAPAGLTAAAVERFVVSRRAGGYRHFLTVGGLAPLLAYLRSLGVAPLPPIAPNHTPAELLVERYRGYLVGERCLAAGTTRYYERVARSFLGEVSSAQGEVDLAGLNASVVGRFVLEECGRRSAGSASNVVVALRSLLRFLHVEGLVAGDLAAAVLAVAPRPRGLPRALPPGAVARLRSSCDRRCAKGRRDYAVLMLLSRLGLRAAEVSAIELADVDWRGGELLVRGKARRRDRLPLPVESARRWPATSSAAVRTSTRSGCSGV